MNTATDEEYLKKFKSQSELTEDDALKLGRKVNRALADTTMLAADIAAGLEAEA